MMTGHRRNGKERVCLCRRKNPAIQEARSEGLCGVSFEAAFNGCMSSVSAGRGCFRKEPIRQRNFPACLGRKVFTKTVEALLKENGGLRSMCG